MIFLIVLLWLMIGYIVGLMASMSDQFETRIFDPVWLIPMGPIGLVVWGIMDYKNAR